MNLPPFQKLMLTWLCTYGTYPTVTNNTSAGVWPISDENTESELPYFTAHGTHHPIFAWLQGQALGSPNCHGAGTDCPVPTTINCGGSDPPPASAYQCSNNMLYGIPPVAGDTVVPNEGYIFIHFHIADPCLVKRMVNSVGGSVTGACGSTPATGFYLAQTAAGAGTGADCADAMAVSYFNSSSNWVGGKIQAGTTVHLCGTVTSALTYQGSGTSTNPITLLFESGAVMTSAAWNTTAIYGGAQSWIVLDLGANGVIQNTANGTTGTFANSLASIGVDFSGSSNALIRNGTIGNIYVRTANSTTDNSAGATGSRCIQWKGGSNNTVNNVTTHDCRFNAYFNVGTDGNFTISNNTGYHQAAHWWIAPDNTGSTMTNITYSGNIFHDPAPAWDTAPPTTGIFHIDGVHQFCQASSTCSGFYAFDNYFYGSFGVDYTAQIFSETNGGTNSNQQVYNNLIVNTTTTQSSNGAIDVQMGANGLLANNTVIGSGSGNGGVGIQIISGTNIAQWNNIVQGFNYLESALAGVTFAASSLNTNLYYDTSNGWQYDGVGASTFAAWKSATGQDGSSISGVNPNLNGSYIPNSGSPAIGAGTNLTSLSITTLDLDLAGVGRPSTGAWGIGAYQFVPSGSSTPVAPVSLVIARNMKLHLWSQTRGRP